MSEIPEDVMDKAHLIWQDANTVNGVFTGDGQSSKYIPIIARAIFAERERCAKVAEEAEMREFIEELKESMLERGVNFDESMQRLFELVEWEIARKERAGKKA